MQGKKVLVRINTEIKQTSWRFVRRLNNSKIILCFFSFLVYACWATCSLQLPDCDGSASKETGFWHEYRAHLGNCCFISASNHSFEIRRYYKNTFLLNNTFLFCVVHFYAVWLNISLTMMLVQTWLFFFLLKIGLVNNF